MRLRMGRSSLHSGLLTECFACHPQLRTAHAFSAVQTSYADVGRKSNRPVGMLPLHLWLL